MLPDEITVNFKIRPKLLLVSPLVVLAVFGLFKLPWGAGSAPAWVQAIGSVTAIIAAIWISNRQTRLATLERQRQNYRYMFKAYQVASNAGATLLTVLDDLNEGKLSQSNISYYRAVLGASITELSAFNYCDMVDFEFGNEWADIARHVALMKSRIEDNAHTPELIPRAISVQFALTVVQKRLTDLQHSLQEHARRVGEKVYQDQHL